MARILRRHGFIVDLAADGVEALEQAAEYPYAVVASDHRMPGLSGLELIAKLRELQPDSTYLLVTASSDVARQGRWAAGIHTFVKPWEEGELVEAVRNGVTEFEHRVRIRAKAANPEFHRDECLLLVEDDDADAERLERCVESNAPGDYQIVRARCASEATAMLDAREFSVVLADLSLPDVSGLAVLRELQVTAPLTPIIALTDGADEDLATRAVQTGAQDYVIKSRLNGDTLLRAIRYSVERKRFEGHLAELAHFDPLTRLANRTLLKDRMTRALARSARLNKATALMLVDLDHFKAVNDTYGHEVGDQLLVEVALRLMGSTRLEDTVARIGGDEFALLLEDLDDPDGARRVAQRVVNAFATPLVVNNKSLPVTPSIGVAIYPDTATTAEELMRHADSALYEVKGSGRNNYRFFGHELQQRVARRVSLEKELLGGLSPERLSIVFQPEFDLLGKEVSGYEALLRWRADDGRMLSASEFIAILEQSGAILTVGGWVLRRVCQEMASWPQGSALRVAVNISARQLAEPDFVDTVKSVLKENGMSGDRLELEISESALSRCAVHARQKIPLLAALGVGLVVDDYGFGHSSLVELANLPLTALKVHPSVGTRLDEGKNRTIVQAITSVARLLEVRAVAKGVEAPDQVEALEELGVDSVQGFFVGRPSANPLKRAHRSKEPPAVLRSRIVEESPRRTAAG